MRHSEADRKAFNKAAKAEARKEQIENWLKENPEIGRLNGNKFYKVVNGEIVEVTPPRAA